MCHERICMHCMNTLVAKVQPLVQPADNGKMGSAPGSQTRFKKPSGDVEPHETALALRRTADVQTKPNPNDNITYFCEKDFYVQVKTRTILYESCYYHENMSSSEAKSVLKPCPVGTFLIRDSSDPNHLYTISVKTKRGPTSIRILYDRGRFCLDADEKSKGTMPTFSSYSELLDYYVRLTAVKIDQCRFLDRSGRKDLPIILDKPRLNKVPDLKSVCRTNINRLLPAKNPVEVRRRIDELPLPKPLRSYLKDYPFII